MKKIVILGAGSAGTMIANKLVKEVPENEISVTVIDHSDIHYYQPGFLLRTFVKSFTELHYINSCLT